MEWLEMAMREPQSNWSIWMVFALFLGRLIWQLTGVLFSMSKNTAQDNAIHSRLIDEMAAWRKSFEKRDEEQARINRQIMSLYQQGFAGVNKRLSAIEDYLNKLHSNLKAKEKIS